MRKQTPVALALAATLFLAAAPAASAKDREEVQASGASIWTHDPKEKIQWFELTGVGTLMVGTDEGLYSLDPDAGTVLWRRDDLKKIDRGRVEEVEGTPLTLVTENTGVVSTKTRLIALETLTGTTVWETDQLKGSTVGVTPIYDRGLLLVATCLSDRAARAKLDLAALSMTTGRPLWQAEFPEQVDLHAVERKARLFQRFDLEGHQPPVYDGESVYLSWAGVHRYDVATGKLVWGVKYDVTDGAVKRANAQTLLEGDTVYTSAKGQVRALDRATGAVRWTSKDFGGSVAELLASEGVLYGRLGGSFYDASSRQWVLKKPLGVVAISKGEGAPLWSFDKAKDSITNMVLVPEQRALLVSDAENLIGLDTGASGKVKETFKVKLEFKHKLGAAGTALKVAKIGLTGIRGLMSKGADTRDFPVAMRRREDGIVVVYGKQHVLAFDPSSRAIPWSIQYAAPGISGWEKIAMAAITAFAYANYTAAAANSYAGTSENRWANDNRLDVLQRYEKVLAKRFSATEASARYVYVLTEVKDGEKDGPGVVAVDMSTGTGDRSVLIRDKEPDYEVDERAGRLFNLENGKQLVAYTFRK
jgi:outer membrane protein assembly factor BamB